MRYCEVRDREIGQEKKLYSGQRRIHMVKRK